MVVTTSSREWSTQKSMSKSSAALWAPPQHVVVALQLLLPVSYECRHARPRASAASSGGLRGDGRLTTARQD